MSRKNIAVVIVAVIAISLIGAGEKPNVPTRVERLEQDVAELKQQVQDLKAQVASLQATIEQLHPVSPDLKDAGKHNKIVLGMTMDQVNQILKRTGVTLSDLPEKDDPLVDGKQVHDEHWVLNRNTDHRLYFRNEVLVEIRD